MKRISDEELVNLQFRFDDPEGISGLSRERPDPSLDPEIVGYYRVRPSGGKSANPQASYVWCCHCQKATHWDGRVVRDKTASTYIIGADCGRKHYGDRFIAIDRAFDEQIARQRLLERWSRTHMLCERMLAELDEVLGDPVWRTIDLRRRQLGRAAPRLVSRLNAIAKRGGRLVIRDRVRDVATEERRELSYQRGRSRYKSLSKPEQARARREGLSPVLEDEPLFMDVEEDLGQVKGRHALTDDGDARSQAIRLRDAVLRITPVNSLGAIRNPQLSRALAEIREAAVGLRGAITETASTWQFFEPANIELIERWYASAKQPPYFISADVEFGGPLGRSEAFAPLARNDHFYPSTLDAILDTTNDAVT